MHIYQNSFIHTQKRTHVHTHTHIIGIHTYTQCQFHASGIQSQRRYNAEYITKLLTAQNWRNTQARMYFKYNIQM